MLSSWKYFERYLTWPSIDKENVPSFSRYIWDTETGNCTFLHESGIFQGIRASEQQLLQMEELRLFFGAKQFALSLLKAGISYSFACFVTCSLHFPTKCTKSFLPHCRSLSATLICTFCFANTGLTNSFKNLLFEGFFILYFCLLFFLLSAKA